MAFLGDRVMYRLSYRNFGTFASLLANHSVTAGSSTGVRCYEPGWVMKLGEGGVAGTMQKVAC
jgi:hypothetical protein